MNITLNNRPETLEGYEKITIEQLLELKKFSYKLLLIRVNNTTIKSDDYDKTVISDGDNVAVIHLMAGG